MKIGYVGKNLTLECSASTTFRLASYSEERFCATLENNLRCLLEILRFNHERGLMFFRLSSETVPFASHSVCTVDWGTRFASQFAQIGAYVRETGMRLSAHPGQFVVVNSVQEKVFESSIAELAYHAAMFDLMGLDDSHKLQIHVGGVYGDKQASLARFVERFKVLPEAVQRRLVVENDDRLFSAADCLWLHAQIGVPMVFDNLHHELLNNGESLRDALIAAIGTWGGKHGLLMVDYSSQEIGGRIGKHAPTLDAALFSAFIDEMRGLDFDIMVEIKDKEVSALRGLEVLREAGRVG
jgi:UV DNA damage endonuclease